MYAMKNMNSKNDDNELHKNNLLKETYKNQEDNQEESKLLATHIPGEEEIKNRSTKLPTNRTRIIMKTDNEINMVNQEAVFLITKATEFFIGALTNESYNYTHQSKKKTIQKYDVQSAIDNVDAFMFLDGML